MRDVLCSGVGVYRRWSAVSIASASAEEEEEEEAPPPPQSRKNRMEALSCAFCEARHIDYAALQAHLRANHAVAAKHAAKVAEKRKREVKRRRAKKKQRRRSEPRTPQVGMAFISRLEATAVAELPAILTEARLQKGITMVKDMIAEATGTDWRAPAISPPAGLVDYPSAPNSQRDYPPVP